MTRPEYEAGKQPWSAALPLAGRRVLVTRAPHQASELVDRLRAAGAEPLLIPAIEIGPPGSFAALDTAIRQMERYDLVCFTSGNGVEAFAERAKALGIGLRARRVAVVGVATARAAKKAGLHVDVVPPVFTAESLGETLRPEAGGRQVLLLLAEDAPTTLRDILTAAGADVTVAAAYSNSIPQGSMSAVRKLVVDGPALDAVTFTSASTARNLAALLTVAEAALPQGVVRASIGPVTSRTLAELGMPAQVEASESTVAGLVDALTAYFAACSKT
ncbi:MAG TPA: uroporphyrinogen-III synthase [Acidobacteriaceae bacterium]|nr:uroporphyrinogen-III synthase [Acidobacteriaceae bacterium]